MLVCLHETKRTGQRVYIMRTVHMPWSLSLHASEMGYNGKEKAAQFLILLVDWTFHSMLVM